MVWQGKALVIGASRGIGYAVAQRFNETGREVVATWNTTRPASGEHLYFYQTDITRKEQMQELATKLEPDIYDFILINSGIYGPAHQDLNNSSHNELMDLFLTNAIAPVQAALHLMPLLRPGYGVIGFTTSRLGSLTENPEAEMPLYAASKAALNVLTRSLIKEADKHQVTLLSLHPGWVKTQMGGDAATLTPDESAAGLVKQMERFRSWGGHHFVDYAGNILTW